MTDDITKPMQGKVKFANSRGFGFIETSINIDFYFHHTQYENGDSDSWKKLLSMYIKGQNILVDFYVDDTALNGPRAINVKYKNTTSI